MAERKTKSGSDDRGRSSVRVLGLTFDRLTFRLACGIAALVILPLSAGLWSLSTSHFDRGIEARRQAAESENRILEVALRHQMMERDNSLVTAVLREVAAHPEVQNVMIVNHDGEVRISSRPERVGERLGRDSPTCLVCHSKDPATRERWVRLEEGSGEVLRTVRPIENKPECHGCHDPKERFNGMLLLDVSLDQMQAELNRDLAWIAVGAALLAILVLGGIVVLVRVLILRRLARVGGATRAVAAGNLSERVPTEGGDVIASLAADFNAMARSVSDLVAEVQQREAQLTSVMNSLDDGLIVLDRDSRVVACNRSFAARIEAAPETLQTRRCHDATAGSLPCCREGQECPASRCMETGTVQRGIFRVPPTSDQPERVEEVYASPVFDERGNVLQVVELWRDITERVKEEEHLAEIERLVSLGVLASGFSHEVNTPLASILTCAESAIGRIDASVGTGDARDLLSGIRESAEIIRQQVLRCRQTTDQFLRFSRGIPPSIEPLDLARRVAEVVSLAAPTARENGVEIRFDRPNGVPAVAANAEVVQHVVLNILVNAIQSCSKGGGRIDVGIAVSDDVRVLVRDSGSGIPDADRAHLFEPFRSRKPQGTGLGLFLSRTFMRRFGGDVRLVETRPGVGSTFEIVFQTAAKVVA